MKEEAAQHAKQQAAANAEARKAALRKSLSPEPASGSADVAQIRLRFRDGSQMQRRFPASRPLQVQAWIGVRAVVCLIIRSATPVTLTAQGMLRQVSSLLVLKLCGGQLCK